MKSLLTLIVMSWVTTMAYSQPNLDLNFNASTSHPGSHHFGGTQKEYGHDAIQASDGSFICLGATFSSDHEVGLNYGSTDMFVYKYTEGDPSNTYGKVFGGDRREDMTAFRNTGEIIETAPGQYAFIATTWSNGTGNAPTKTHPHPLNFDTWFVSISENSGSFNTDVSVLFGQEGHDKAYDLIQIPGSSDIFIAGTSNSKNLYPGAPTRPGSGGNYEAFILRVNSSGIAQNMGLFGGTLQDEIHAIDIYDGYIYVAGRSKSTFSGSTPMGGWDFFIAKLQMDYTVVWTKTFGSTADDYIKDIKVNSNGIYTVGYTKGLNTTPLANLPNGIIPLSYGNNREDGWAGKFDHDGIPLEARTYGGTNFDFLYSLELTSSGNVLVIGDTHSSDGDVSANKGGYDMWVLELDQNLNMSWERATGTTYSQFGRAIFQTQDGGIMAFGDGTGRSDGDFLESHSVHPDFQLVKFEADCQSQFDYSYPEQRWVEVLELDPFTYVGVGFNGTGDIVLQKIKPDGTLLGSQVVYDFGNSIVIWFACRGQNGDILVAGRQGPYIHLLKFSSNLQFINSVTTDFPSPISTPYVSGLFYSQANNSIFLSGRFGGSSIVINGNTFSINDFGIIRFDYNLNPIWAKSLYIPGGQLINVQNGIEVGSNSDLVLTGTRLPSNKIGTVKIDIAGTILDHYVPNAPFVGTSNIVKEENTTSNLYFVSTGYTASWVLKLDSDLDEIWSQTFSSYQVSDLLIGQYNDLIMGSFSAPVEKVFSTPSNGSGTINWNKTYSYNGRTLANFFDDCGNIFSTGGGTGGDGKVRLIEIDQNGNALRESVVIEPNFTALNIEDELSIYPNPAYSELNIHSSLNLIQNISIMDYTGKQLLSKALMGQKDHTLDLNELDAGIYLLQVEYNDGSREVRRIMKE